MRPAALSLALPLALAGLAATAETLPEEVAAAAPEIRRETEEAFALCREAGGEPRVAPEYLGTGDLNGDGVEDYVLDLGALDCAGTGPLFCGAGGCPVTVWLSGPGGHARAWGGFARSARIEDAAVILTRDGAYCIPPTTAPEGCEERLGFADVVPAAVAAPGTEAPEDATAAAPPDAAPEPEAAAPPDTTPVGGWTLRAVPDGSPVATSDGPGALASVSAFCLSGEPFLALDLAPAPAAEAVRAAFAFPVAATETTIEARAEEGAGGAYVAALADGPLATLLSGRDVEVTVTLDGAPQGVLSLRGSTRAIRDALAPCHDF
jgi:hypothetical protein